MSVASFSFPASASGATAASGSNAFVDNTNDIWTLSGSGSVLRNGAVASGSGATLALWFNNLIWYQDNAGNWWRNDLGTLNWHLYREGDPRGIPSVQSATFNETLPPVVGVNFATMLATNSPTIWSIVNGNYNGYYAINNSGRISAQAQATAFATNLILQSQTVDNATWSKTGLPENGAPWGTSVITANAIAAPDGTTTADLLAEGTATNYFRITQAVSTAAATPCTFSCYLKAQSRTRAYLQLDDAHGPEGAVVIFDLAGGQIGVSPFTFGSGWTAGTATITLVGSSWYRCALTATTTGTSSSIVAAIGIDQGSGTAPASGNQLYTGLAGGTTGVFVWGTQLEQASSVGPYVQTTTSAVTQASQPFGTQTLTVQATNSAGSGQGTATITTTSAALLSRADVITVAQPNLGTGGNPPVVNAMIFNLGS